MHTDPKARLVELEQRCAAAGIPVTTQRRTVLEVLVTRSDHPSAEQIFCSVAERLPDVSRATVYRSLETLAQLTLVRRVEHPGSAVRYDGNTEPHHHFLCTRCGSIEDLPLASVRGHDLLALHGIDDRIVDEITLSVRGACQSCAAESA